MKSITLIIATFIALTSFAQEDRAFIPEEVFNNSVTRTFHFSSNEFDHAPINSDTQQRNPEITMLGSTYHDFFTFGALRQQIYNHQNSNTVAVWTHTEDFENDYADMGTVYSYTTYGEGWTSNTDTHIEDHKARFPSYALWGENGEVVTSQQENGINIYTRPEKGTGDWQHQLLTPQNEISALQNPHMITSGANNEIIHVAAATNEPYQGQKSALLYSRSLNGGQSWEQQNIVLEGTGDECYAGIYGDEYCFTTKSDTIALVIGSPWHDVFYLISYNNGASWEKHMVWEHPVAMFDFETTVMPDTIWCPDGSLTASFDDLGKLHIAFGLTRVSHPETGFDFNHFLWTDGMVYWNESMTAFTAIDQKEALSYENLETDKTLVGWAIDNNGNNILYGADNYALPEYPNLGLSTMPSFMKYKNLHGLCLSYSSSNESITGSHFYRKIFARNYFYSPTVEDTSLWQNITHVTPDQTQLFDEFKTAQTIPISWGINYHDLVFLYAKNNSPGIFFEQENLLSSIETTEFYDFTITNPLITDIDPIRLSSFSLHQNHPNPCIEETTITFEIPSAREVTLEVSDLRGQSILIKTLQATQGIHEVKISTTNFKRGIYFYSLRDENGNSMTKKMMIL